MEYIQCDPGASKWVDVFTEIEGILVGHFNFVRKGAGNTVRAILAKYGMSCIQNHVHRGAMIFQRAYPNKQLVGVENFCMCKLDPAYMKFPDWVNGMSVIKDGKIKLIPFP